MIQSISSDNGTAQKKRDDNFIHNLHRIAGRTDCITPDTVLEVLFYVHHENVVELLEFEQNYTGDIFNDAALDLEVCSIEVYQLKVVDMIISCKFDYTLCSI